MGDNLLEEKMKSCFKLFVSIGIFFIFITLLAGRVLAAECNTDSIINARECLLNFFDSVSPINSLTNFIIFIIIASLLIIISTSDKVKKFLKENGLE